jgi:hypothetical protein
VLLQDRNDLLFRMPLPLHRLVLSQGQTPVRLGSIQGGNVTHILWKQSINAPFPNLPAGVTRTDIYTRLDQFRKFRNAVMHHYAIFDKNPVGEYQNIRYLVGAMNPETLWLLSELSNPAAVLQQRPLN